MINQRAQEYCDAHGHYGLIITEKTKAFAAANPLTFSDDILPTVDIEALPESMGIANWLQIENQASQGACQGHALTTSLEIAIYRGTNGQVLQLCRQWAYIQSQICDGGARGDRGSSLEGGAEAAETVGICLEELSPYTGRYYTRFPDACKADAETRKLRTHKSIPNYDYALRWLVHGFGGLEIGIGWNGSMEPGSDGKIDHYRGGGGGHALALTDWNKKIRDSQGRPYLQLDNSWSENWGLKGRAFIAPSVVEQWCRDETVIGHSDMYGTGIKPRRFDWIKNSFFN